MRWGVWGATLVAVVGLAPAARADIYRYRDASGALVFTNAPSEVASRVLVVRERRAPAPPPPAVVSRRLADLLGRPIPLGLPTSYDGLIREIAARHNVEYALVKAIIKAESGFDRLAVSSKGALGLMQLMPGTAAQHQVRNVFTPRENIEGGVRHLRMLLDRYGGNLTLAIAAYNAGSRRVEDAGGIPPIAETREYLARVLRYRVAYMREASGVLQARR